MSTSFYQYRFCSLCKISHKQRKKKHIYSQRHQLVLKNVLAKFGKKVQEGRRQVEGPAVHAMGWESGACVWCYFCQAEVGKHQMRDDCIVACAAFLTHLASQEHSQKMHEFFWENLVPADKKKSFFVCGKEINRFMENAERAVADYQEKQKEKLAQVTEEIRAAEQRSREITWIGQQEELVKASLAKPGSASGSRTSGLQGSDSADAVPIGKKTVFAFGHGLSCISLSQNKGESGGNVHTGATPPWMMEEEEEKRGEIGPTAETFAKHLQRLQKQKLPACRVGAGFNRKADTSAQWLPDFGRVWNSGRRLNSRHQFLKERSSGGCSKRGAVHRTATATATSASTETSHPQPVVMKEVTAPPWNKRQRCDPSPSTTAYGDHSVLSAGSVRSKSHTVVRTPGVNGDIGIGNPRFLDPSTGPYDTQRHYPQPWPLPSCSYSDNPPPHHGETFHPTHISVTSTAPLDRISEHWDQDRGVYQSTSPGVKSPETDSQDVSVVDGCRPYKRRRGVSSAQALMNTGRIAITPALLSQPARTKKS